MKLFFQRCFLSISFLFCIVSVIFVAYSALFPHGLLSPKLVCKQQQLNMGTVNVGDEPIGIFTIENQGNGRLIIRDVLSGCPACLEVLEYPEEYIKPGSTAEIKIRLLTDQLTGFTHKQIIVRSNDPQKPVLPLEVIAIIDRNEPVHLE